MDGLPILSLLYRQLSPQGRQVLVDYARNRWSPTAIGGVASIGSCAIALWAMTRAPVASVAALRETSVLLPPCSARSCSRSASACSAPPARW